jgi:hypothetical protein
MRRKLIAIFLLAVCSGAPAKAHAQEFGSKGQAVFSAERLMGITGSHVETDVDLIGDVENDWTNISFGWRGPVAGDFTPFDVPRVGFDYFVIDRLSVGGSLGYASLNPDEGDDISAFLFAPRVGYAHAFSRVVAIWPRGGFTYHSGQLGNFEASGFALSLECPFTFSPTEHFAFHVGPTFDVDLSGSVEYDNGNDADRTYRTFGVHAGLLGWF